MTSVQASGVHIQVRHNHVATIKRKALGGPSATNPSDLPNAVVNNREYDEDSWVEYRDAFHVMQDVVTSVRGTNNILSPYLN